MKRSVLLALTVLLASIASAQGTVPRTILAKLTNGVNITRWFCYLGGEVDPVDHFKTYMKPADFVNFGRLGVRYVRLCVSPDVIYDNGKPNAGHLPYLDGALGQLTGRRLAVLLDLHDNGQLKLDQPNHDNSGFVSFWKTMALHYRGRYYDSVVFELLNEPVFMNNPQVWYALQEKTVKAIRAIDPKRTIMVSGTSWSGIDAMQQLPQLAEQNLIYTFHCYDPFYFTHQGASWVGSQPGSFKEVPFPSSPEAVAAILAENRPENKAALIDYGAQRFGATYLAQRIALGMKYGQDHGVPVVLGEFGAYPPVSPPASRAAWFRAMKAAVTSANAPYCIWGYDDALGLGRNVTDAGITLDPVTLQSFYGIQP